MSNNNQTELAQQQLLLKAEATARIRRALRKIEDAQNSLNDACATLSSLRHASPQWKATSALADRVKAHWYKVRDALEYGPASRKICLDPLAEETVLRNARTKVPVGAEQAGAA